MHGKSARNAVVGKVACVWAGLALAITAGLNIGESRAAKSDAPKQADASQKVPGKITFVGKNKIATANGTFKKWHFTKIEIDPDRKEGPIVELGIEVDVASLDTGIKKRDDHLRNPDFFDVEKYPKAHLRLYATKAKPKSKKVHLAKLDLDLHGVKKTFDIEFRITSREPLRIRGKLIVKRTDFKIGKPPSRINPMSIDDEISITFNATLVAPSDP